MAHIEQIKFCTKVKELHPDHFKNKKVLDAGCLDINGNNRYLFDDCFYVGVDLGTGNNVDLTSKVCDLTFRDGFFETIISTESLEHDPTYYLTLNNIVRMLAPGGFFIMTCAGKNRGEHGTLRMDPNASPFTKDIPIWANYYKNITEEDFRFCLDVDSIFDKYEFSVNDVYPMFDTYFWGIKK